jgi:hypothetical protein
VISALKTKIKTNKTKNQNKQKKTKQTNKQTKPNKQTFPISFHYIGTYRFQIIKIHQHVICF